MKPTTNELRMLYEGVDGFLSLLPPNFTDEVIKISKNMNFSFFEIYYKNGIHKLYLISDEEKRYFFECLSDVPVIRTRYGIVKDVSPVMVDEDDATPSDDNYVYNFYKLKERFLLDSSDKRKALVLSSKKDRILKFVSKNWPGLSVIYNEQNYPYYKTSDQEAFTSRSEVEITCTSPDDEFFMKVIEFLKESIPLKKV